MRALLHLCPPAGTTKPFGKACRRDSSHPTCPCAGAFCSIAWAPASACSTSAVAKELADAGARVVGVDVAEEPLRRARARHPQLDLRLVPAEGAWDLQDASFDVVWAGEVIEHVADTAAWLSEVRRVLRSGGSLLLSTPAHAPLTLMRLACSRRAFASHFDPLGDHLRFYSRHTLAGLLADFGFTAIEVRSAGGPPWVRRVLLARAIRRRY